jgi:hypothetical protein
MPSNLRSVFWAAAVAGQQGQGGSVAKELMVMNLVSVVVLNFVVWLHLTP